MKLNNDTLGAGFRDVPQGFERAMRRGFARIHAENAKQPPRRYARRLSFPIVLTLVSAIAFVGFAAALLGGVLHFSENYIDDHENTTIQFQAQSLVQTDVARFDFGHVTMEITEAVYDGQELRVVYALSDPTVTTAYPDNPWQTIELMTGLGTDGVWSSCDNADIDGQPVYWENERMEGADTPGKVLFYKRTTLAAWGVTPPVGEFTVRLHMLQNADDADQPSFTMDGGIAAQYIRYGSADSYQKDGLTVALTSATFTPLRAALRLHITLDGAIDGDDTMAAAEGWLTGDNLYLPDGTALAGYREGYDPDNPVLDVMMLFDPPADGWPDTLTLRSANDEILEVHIQ